MHIGISDPGSEGAAAVGAVEAVYCIKHGFMKCMHPLVELPAVGGGEPLHEGRMFLSGCPGHPGQFVGCNHPCSFNGWQPLRVSREKRTTTESKVIIFPGNGLWVTPATPKAPVFFRTPPLTSRFSGMDEFFLKDDFEYFEKALFSEYKTGYAVSFLNPSV